MPLIASRQPAAAKACARPRPIPDVEPVMTTLESRSKIVLSQIGPIQRALRVSREPMSIALIPQRPVASEDSQRVAKSIARSAILAAPVLPIKSE